MSIFERANEMEYHLVSQRKQIIIKVHVEIENQISLILPTNRTICAAPFEFNLFFSSRNIEEKSENK